VRVGVVDIGTNSTRLLIADVDGDRVTELDRRTRVTRLGEGVDASGALGPEAMARVYATLDDYCAAIDDAGCSVTTAVLTSAVRDAANGSDFTAQVRDRYRLDARTIGGDEEAQLTFLGATSERDPADRRPLVLVDIGGGSTEFVVGAAHEVAFHVSTQAGVVRQTERHLRSDPPDPGELEEMAREVRDIIGAAVPEATRRSVEHAIAVAGTPTSLAAIDLELEPYDPERVHGHHLSLEACEQILARLTALTTEERQHVTGLHPDRAPTIVAGVVILIQALRAFGLHQFEVSEHDILRGAAIARARTAQATF
jgi:exopolyphosphatase/guanosine-5'-triphosphate,3'-diphosphate pyrophosphatase